MTTCLIRITDGPLLLEEYFLVAGVKQGPHRKYYRNGRLESTEYYVDGLREGENRVYDNTGAIRIESHYKEDHLEGIYKEYINGQLISVAHFQQGQRHGLYSVYYYDTGSLMLEEHYEHDLREGTYIKYHRNGKIHTHATYKAGKLKHRTTEYSMDGTYNPRHSLSGTSQFY